MAGHQCEHGARQGVLVGAPVGRITGELFRGRVRRGRPDAVQAAGDVDRRGGILAGRSTAHVRCLFQPGDAEVGDQRTFGLPVLGAGKHDVGRLHVAMHHTAAVCSVQCFGDLRPDVHHTTQRQRTVAAQQAVGVHPVDELHGDPRVAVLDAAIEHSDDVRVVQPRDGLGLALEAGSGTLVGGVRRQ